MISIIAAIDSKRGIGKDNKIPWHIKEDLVHLKELTKNKIVILGRNTFESMVYYYQKSGKQMPGDLYLVITSKNEYKTRQKNAKTIGSIEEAIKEAKGQDVFIIGGGQIFKEAIEKNIVDKLYLTIVEGDFNCDVFFPEYNSFKIVSEHAGQENNYKYKFQELDYYRTF